MEQASDGHLTGMSAQTRTRPAPLPIRAARQFKGVASITSGFVGVVRGTSWIPASVRSSSDWPSPSPIATRVSCRLKFENTRQRDPEISRPPRLRQRLSHVSLGRSRRCPRKATRGACNVSKSALRLVRPGPSISAGRRSMPCEPSTSIITWPETALIGRP